MDLADAAVRWSTVISQCDHLIAIHGRRETRGRRWNEFALNRAVVVMAVAAWQAAAEDMTTAAVDAAEPDSSSPMSLASYRLLAGQARKAVGDLATPHGENVRNMMVQAGFDPWPHWIVPSHRQGVPALRPRETEEWLRKWLRVRHAIAHGDAHLPSVDVLSSVRADPSDRDPSLRLDDAKRCAQFIRDLTSATGAGMATHLGQPNPDW